MRLIKAGESHGKAMCGIICGAPSGLMVDKRHIDQLLRERSGAYGRSSRQKKERSGIEILSGIRGGMTLGSNIAFIVKNAAYSEYKDIMDVFDGSLNSGRVTAVRPNHADLAGMQKYGFSDARNVFESASARNTVCDVCGGAIALKMLSVLGIKITAFVRRAAVYKDDGVYSFSETENAKPPLYFLKRGKIVSDFKEFSQKIASEGDTYGGVIEINVSGLKSGFGSAENKLDGAISDAVCSVQTIKGVYFGDNLFFDSALGSEYSETLNYDGAFFRTNTHMGGITGGLSNGTDIKFTVCVKPIPTVNKGVETVDFVTHEKTVAEKMRADTTAVFALCPILRCVTALALSEVVSARLGGDSIYELIKRYDELC